MKHWHHRGGRGRREAHPTQPTSKERIVQGEESLRRRGARRWGEVFLFHFLCLSYELYFFITGYLILCMLSLVSFILFKACLISKRLVLTSTSGEWTLNNSSVNVDNVKEFNKFIQIILIFCPRVAHRRGYRTLMRHCPSSFFKVKVQKLIQFPLRSAQVWRVDAATGRLVYKTDAVRHHSVTRVGLFICIYLLLVYYFFKGYS